jgi:hypothetical protein
MARSFGWWLMAGAGLFWEKSTAGWLLVAGLFWSKSTVGWWLISQANRLLVFPLYIGRVMKQHIVVQHLLRRFPSACVEQLLPYEDNGDRSERLYSCLWVLNPHASSKKSSWSKPGVHHPSVRHKRFRYLYKQKMVQKNKARDLDICISKRWFCPFNQSSVTLSHDVQKFPNFTRLWHTKLWNQPN